MNNIKNLKPRKNGRFKQGVINPQSCKKLFPSQKNEPIIYRSSYEKRFIEWLETCKDVEMWGSECTPVKYINAYDGKTHTYYPDYVALVNGIMCIYEVKPYNQCVPPNSNIPKDSYAWKTYITNMSKWKACQRICESKGMKFKIITEKTINRL